MLRRCFGDFVGPRGRPPYLFFPEGFDPLQNAKHAIEVADVARIPVASIEPCLDFADPVTPPVLFAWRLEMDPVRPVRCMGVRTQGEEPRVRQIDRPPGVQLFGKAAQVSLGHPVNVVLDRHAMPDGKRRRHGRRWVRRLVARSDKPALSKIRDDGERSHAAQ
jgi:hypothetical protein